MSGIPSLIHELKNSQLKLPESPKVDSEVKNLLEKMLGITEQDRVSWEEIFNHQYFLNKEKAQKDQQDAMNNVFLLTIGKRWVQEGDHPVEYVSGRQPGGGSDHQDGQTGELAVDRRYR